MRQIHNLYMYKQYAAFPYNTIVLLGYIYLDLYFYNFSKVFKDQGLCCGQDPGHHGVYRILHFPFYKFAKRFSFILTFSQSVKARTKQVVALQT